MNMNNYEIKKIAFSLFDGGWREEDREELIREYDLTEEEADEICEILSELKD